MAGYWIDLGSASSSFRWQGHSSSAPSQPSRSGLKPLIRLRFMYSLCFLNLSLLSSLGLSPPCSSFPGGDDWASGGAICPVFAQPFAGDEHILQVCPPLLFPSAVRDGAPQTLTKLFVFGSESSYNVLPTNFDFVCKNYRVYMFNQCHMLGPPLMRVRI